MERCEHQFQTAPCATATLRQRTLSGRSQMPHAGQRGQNAIGGRCDHQSQQKWYMPNVKCYIPLNALEFPQEVSFEQDALE